MNILDQLEVCPILIAFMKGKEHIKLRTTLPRKRPESPRPLNVKSKHEALKRRATLILPRHKCVRSPPPSPLIRNSKYLEQLTKESNTVGPNSQNASAMQSIIAIPVLRKSISECFPSLCRGLDPFLERRRGSAEMRRNRGLC